MKRQSIDYYKEAFGLCGQKQRCANWKMHKFYCLLHEKKH